MKRNKILSILLAPLLLFGFSKDSNSQNNNPENKIEVAYSQQLNPQNQEYRRIFEERRNNHSLIPPAINEPIVDQLNTFLYSQKEIISNLDKIKKELKNNNKISKTDKGFLKNYVQSFKGKTKLTWYQKDAIYYLNKIKTREINQYLKIIANQFFKTKLDKIDPNLILKHVRQPQNNLNVETGIPIIDFSKINASLSRDIFVKCNLYNLNLKLVYTIFLIENNFGLSKSSSKGAKGMSQVMNQFLVKIYGSKKSYSNWETFLASFEYLKMIEKELNINLSNLNEISNADFILALNGYFDGVTNMHNAPEKIYSQKDIGFQYALKGVLALSKIKYKIPSFVNKGKIIDFQNI